MIVSRPLPRPRLRNARTARTALAVVATLGTLVAARPASAQDARDASSDFVERRSNDGTSIVFKDNLLSGDALGAAGFVVTTGPRVARMGLVRPRLQFVSELLKSVELL